MITILLVNWLLTAYVNWSYCGGSSDLLKCKYILFMLGCFENKPISIQYCFCYVSKKNFSRFSTHGSFLIR